MNFTLQELKSFEETAVVGNISKAAVRLGLTQPALSWQIRKLEDQFGEILFHRTKKGVTLTRAGETLLTRSRTLLRDWENLGLKLNQGEEELKGSYTLGVHPLVGLFTLPRFCPALHTNYPEIRLKLVHDLSRIIAEDVLGFKLDYGIVVNPPPAPDLTIVDLYEDHIGFWTAPRAGPPGDPHAAQSVIICNPDMVQTDALVSAALKSGILKSKRIMYTTDLQVIAGLTAAGGGIGLMPATIAQNLAGGPLLALPNGPVHPDVISLIWRGEAQKSAASRAVRKTIIEQVAAAEISAAKRSG